MTDAAYVFSSLEKDTEENGKKFREAEKAALSPKPIRASPEMSLAHMIRQGYSQEQYQNEINFSKQHNARYLASYKEVQQAKKKCYPENMTIEPGLFQVSIKDVTMHQLKGIIEWEGLHEWMLKIQNENPDFEWEFIYKYGGDGSLSDFQYQTADAVDNPSGTIFTSTYVPLYLKAVSKSNPKNYIMVYAEQMAVSETRVIPLRMALEKETASIYLSNSKHVHVHVIYPTYCIIFDLQA